ncbi:hypothetical protein [Mesorhizobium ciceri]|uniref:RHS repeat-associated core domain-containing protein n=1 Tax=Mesorhizobium ciceri biovar biserrulae (strain HAMBI 2942 / LMG 23838 / WSM1271) TaxID=765698 RepID=E8TJS6_MESCW|nr:hypothetical protein [Mesorhizobium ciceri]ADV14937.1 hypothetical protein Mesci_5930 [Mesorhizobium ciceri biovar biserrulae WSM1271]
MIQRILAIILTTSMLASGPARAYATYGVHLPQYDANADIQPVRFISPDPMDPTVPSVGTNRYAYAGNDPVNKSDQNGLCPVCIGIAIGATVSYFSGTTEANTPETPDDVSQTSETMAMANMVLGATTAGPARSLAMATERSGFSFAQRTYDDAFSYGKEGGQAAYSKIAGSKIKTVDDLANAISAGKVNPSKISVDVGTVGGKTYIMNTRTAVALDKAGISRSKWTIVDKTKDKAAMKRLSDQLERNNVTPGRTISKVTSKSESLGGQASQATESSGGGLLGAIGKATGLW